MEEECSSSFETIERVVLSKEEETFCAIETFVLIVVLGCKDAC